MTPLCLTCGAPMMRVFDSRDLMLCRIHEVCPSPLLPAILWEGSSTGEYRAVPAVIDAAQGRGS